MNIQSPGVSPGFHHCNNECVYASESSIKYRITVFVVVQKFILKPLLAYIAPPPQNARVFWKKILLPCVNNQKEIRYYSCKQKEKAFIKFPFLRKAFKIIFLFIIKHEKSAILCVSLPLRLLRRCRQGLHLRAFDCDEISKTDFRSLAGSDWYSRRGAARGLPEAEQWSVGRIVGNNPRKSWSGTRAAGPTVL